MNRRRFTVVPLAILALAAGGCANAFEGAATGGALGALAGMGLGSLSGDMGKGAAAGAILGGLGGAILGDQNARNSCRGGLTWGRGGGWGSCPRW